MIVEMVQAVVRDTGVPARTVSHAAADSAVARVIGEGEMIAAREADRLKDLAERAKAGAVTIAAWGGNFDLIDFREDMIATFYGGEIPDAEARAQFVAEAPEIVLDLLDIIEEQQREIAALTRQVGEQPQVVSDEALAALVVLTNQRDSLAANLEYLHQALDDERDRARLALVQRGVLADLLNRMARQAGIWARLSILGEGGEGEFAQQGDYADYEAALTAIRELAVIDSRKGRANGQR